MPPIRHSGLGANTRRMIAVFVVVFIRSTVGFQKFLHNVSSLVKKKDNSVFEIPRLTYFFVYFPFSESCKG